MWQERSSYLLSALSKLILRGRAVLSLEQTLLRLQPQTRCGYGLSKLVSYYYKIDLPPLP